MSESHCICVKTYHVHFKLVNVSTPDANGLIQLREHLGECIIICERTKSPACTDKLTVYAFAGGVMSPILESHMSVIFL